MGAEDIAVLPPFIVSGKVYRFLALEQLREAGIEPSATLLSSR
jgi:hypothetical protein